MRSYGKLSTEFYDLDKPQPPKDALVFYISQCQLAGGPILEPMCGSGRFLISLIQEGFEVVGVDASADMLAACRRKSRLLGLAPSLYQQYLQELDVPGSYPLVMIPAGSFGLVTDYSEVRKSLRRIYKLLPSNGRFVLEIDQLLDEPDPNPEPGEKIITRPDGVQIKIISTGRYDPMERVYHGINRYQLLAHGEILEQEFESFNLRYYKMQELIEVLEDTGFRVLVVHAAYNPSIPMPEADSLIIISTRP